MACAVLIVDDNSAVRSLLVRLIRRASPDATVLDVAEGAAALALCRRYQPRVVLLDHGLPDMSGFSVLRDLKALPGAPYVIMITGNPSLEQEALHTGADEVWLKPMDVPRMLEQLSQVILAHHH